MTTNKIHFNVSYWGETKVAIKQAQYITIADQAVEEFKREAKLLLYALFVSIFLPKYIMLTHFTSAERFEHILILYVCLAFPSMREIVLWYVLFKVFSQLQK